MLDQLFDIFDDLGEELTDLSCNLTLEQYRAVILAVKPFVPKETLDAIGRQLYSMLKHD